MMNCFTFWTKDNLNGSIEMFETRQMAEQMRNYKASCGFEVSAIAEIQPQTFDPQPPTTIQHPQQQSPVCSICGGPLTYIQEYDKWYCYRDRAYSNDTQPSGFNILRRPGKSSHGDARGCCNWNL